MSATFTWSGRQSGNLVNGRLEAESESQAARSLREAGITPLRIERALSVRPAPSLPVATPSAAEAPAAQGAISLGKLFASKRVKPAQRMMLYQQLATQLDAGVPLLMALETLSATTQHDGLREVLTSLAERIRGGVDLSSAMSAHPHAFDRFSVAMIHVGETTGSMDKIFEQLAAHEEFHLALRRQVNAALRYPIFVILAMAVALLVINLFVIPTFEQMFASFGAQLPILTQALIFFSRMTVKLWWVGLLGAGFAYYSFKKWLASDHGRLVFDRFVLNIPLVGLTIRKATLARFSRSLSMAVSAGVPIEQAFGLIVSTLDNAHMSARVAIMRQAIARGETIQQAAVASGEFTPLVLQMIGVGEQTGMVDRTMQRVARFYSDEVKSSLQTLAQAIEPVLIVMIGAIVLVVALGVFMPMWNLNQMAVAK